MLQLSDGRICLTYDHCEQPYGQGARIGEDDSQTWAKEMVLHDNADTRDLGYPRTVQRPDGKIRTASYYNDSPKENEITKRYIAATIE